MNIDNAIDNIMEGKNPFDIINQLYEDKGETMIGFYHRSDLDGKCSGAILRKKFGNQIKLIGINYGDEFPWEDVKDKVVYMADFSLQPFEDMVKLNDLAKEFYWIDHHKSSIEEYEKSDLDLGDNAILDNNTKAGCELTWEFLFGGETPKAVRMLSMYDIWNHETEDIVLFELGMSGQDCNIESDIWNEVFDSNVDFISGIIEKGKVIQQYQNQKDEGFVNACAFELEWEGLNFIALNGGKGSLQFESIWDPNKYDAMLIFFMTKDKVWSVSMYSEGDTDVSEIAKKYDGGGHKNAAGCQFDSLPPFLK